MSITTKEQLEMLNQKIKELAGVYKGAVDYSNISENEFWIWYALIIMGGDYSQQEICSTWSLSKQTVNTIIMNFVRNGFVKLDVVPGTRNKKIVRLTEEGRAYGEKIVTSVATAEQRAFERLSLSDRMAFMGALTKYMEYLREELDETK